jgi:hypothetical protein
MMSISPLAGQGPYTESSGSIPGMLSKLHQVVGHRDLHMAGQSQFPCGSLAVTSTLPYLMLTFPFVLIRAERTGEITVPSVAFERCEQAKAVVPVHVPSPSAELVRLRVYPSMISWSVIDVVSLVRVGTM